MQRLDFDTVAVVSNGVLGERLGWNRGFDEYAETWKLAPESSDDPLEYRHWLNARVVNQLALPLLERRREADRLFAWIHYSDPHAPYYLPADVENRFVGDEYFDDPTPVVLDNPAATALGDRRDLGYYVAQYDANVRFTDDHFSALLDHLDRLGLLEDSLVIFSADHGESLGEHDYYFGHGRLPYNQGSVVPLVFWYPGRAGSARRVSHPVQMVDLYPTLWELLAPDQEPIPGLEGRSLVPALEGTRTDEGPRLAFAEAGGGSPTTHFRSVQDEQWKLIFHPEMDLGKRKQEATWELYDLASDPGETQNLPASEAREFRRLRHALKQWMKGEDWIRRSPDEVEAYSQETLDALKALGYI
jgi:arylsulfatase A-like enzyme